MMDEDDIVKSSILQPLPFTFGEHVLDFCQEHLTLNTRPLMMVRLVKGEYAPFVPNSVNTFALLPEYDIEGYRAFIFNRYAWGMNIGVGYLDEGAIYLGESYNFDWPTPLAVKCVESEISVFVKFDSNTGTRYGNTVFTKKGASTSYHCGTWKKTRIVDDFADIAKKLPMARGNGA